MTKAKQTKRKQKKSNKPRVSQPKNMMGKTTVISRNNVNRPGIPKSFFSKVCSQVNPFCAEALGGKIHDISSDKTLTLQSRLLYNLNTNADGTVYLYMRGSAADPLYECAVAGGVMSGYLTPQTVPQYTALTGQIGGYRVVSFGVRFIPTANYMTSQGYVIAHEVNNAPAVGVSVLSTTLSNVNVTRSIVGEPLIWVSRPTDLEYTDFKGWSDLTSGAQRTALVLSFNGAAANTEIGLVEVVLNFEMIPTVNTVASYFPTEAAPANPALMDAASNTARSIDPFFHGQIAAFDKLIMDEVKSVGGTLIRSGGSALRSAIMGAL